MHPTEPTPSAATPSLVIVAPAFEDTEACGRLVRELVALFGDTMYFVVVDDGSVRERATPQLLSSAGAHGAVIQLRRNVGHQRAIAVGLNYVAHHMPSVPRVVVMDSDGEDLPTSVPELLERLQPADIDVAVARRRSRLESRSFRAFYTAYRYIFQLMTGRTIAFGNFMAMKPGALRRLVAMQELWIHLAGTILVSRLRVAECAIDRGRRYAGESKLNFTALLAHGFRALTVFAEDVLVRVGIACAMVAALSVVGGAAAIVLKVLGYATPGWFSIALGILLLVFLQTGCVTLMTLMLTGIVRGGVVPRVDYEEFIERVFHVAAERASR